MQSSLWPDDGPQSLDATARVPTLTLYPADDSNGAAVVVCPGGGYGGHADHEADPVARWLNTLGVTGVVLKYRLGPQSRHPMMLQDAARAVRTVRARAGEWDLDPNRVGISASRRADISRRRWRLVTKLVIRPRQIPGSGCHHGLTWQS